MKTREYQLDKLARARELQDEAAKLHIPMPVLSWNYEVRDKDGEIVETGIGKANSYTRTALNFLAWNLGYASGDILNSTVFGDGIISSKRHDGSIADISTASRSATSSINYVKVSLGTATEEFLNDYLEPEYVCTTSVGSTFNTTTRKLITFISGVFINITGGSLAITEAAISPMSNSTADYLAVHDVFSAVTVPNGATMIWTYVTEVSYPNP